MRDKGEENLETSMEQIFKVTARNLIILCQISVDDQQILSQ